MKSVTIAAIAVVTALSSCTKMEQYYPNGQVVSIDGIEFSVSPIGNKAGSYKAMPNNPRDQSFITIDPMIWVRNTKAIEKATGCAVYRESIKNHDNTTFASVDCSLQPTP